MMAFDISLMVRNRIAFGIRKHEGAKDADELREKVEEYINRMTPLELLDAISLELEATRS